MIAIWAISAAAIAGILFRPREWPEAIWACSGALLLVLFRLIPLASAGSAIAKGSDVYLFLTGMMLLAELARAQSVFDWVAGKASEAAKGSRTRLFLLIYAAGTAVTVFLSNDATAVVLTPAVYAVVKRSRVPAAPFLYACAFIANAASFVLPISNPANLVVYGSKLPPLAPWLRVFGLPSVLSIGATFIAMRFYFREPLRGTVEAPESTPALSRQGRFALAAIFITGAILIAASALGRDLGLPTCIAAICAVLLTARSDATTVVKGVSWTVLPLVAGLFVIVEGLNQAGAGTLLQHQLTHLANLPLWQGTLGASFGIAALSNLMNNLPSGLLAGNAVQAVHISHQLRDAVLVGVDLGPNLSVTGSLATVLWLIAIRREGEQISGWTFLKAGALVMPPALLLATLALLY